MSFYLYQLFYIQFSYSTNILLNQQFLSISKILFNNFEIFVKIMRNNIVILFKSCFFDLFQLLQ